jgi:hypothetical protein
MYFDCACETDAGTWDPVNGVCDFTPDAGGDDAGSDASIPDASLDAGAGADAHD